MTPSLSTTLRRGSGLALGLALLLGAAGCDDTTNPFGDARIRVQLTDAPSDYIDSAVVWISHVYLQRGDDEPEGDEAPPERIDLFFDEDDPREYDLMLLRDGLVAELTGEVEIPEGDYRQLRLVVDSAFVTLADGYEFNGGGSTAALKVPSGSKSGIKVQLDSEIDADSGETVILLVDFDVDQNFVIQGNPETPAGINGILFTPTLRERSRAVEDEGES